MEDVKLLSAILSGAGRLDLLVHCAGITRDQLMVRYSSEGWDEVIGVNLKSAFLLCRELIPLMIKSGGGHIILVSSYSGLHGREGQSAYSASKAGLIGFARSIARELARYRIHVNVVVPGYLPVGMGARTASAARAAKNTSITGELSDPENTALFIAYLSSTTGITGQVFCLENHV